MPNVKALNLLAKKLGLSDAPIEEICSNSNVNQVIHESIKEIGFKYKLKRSEIPVKITVCHEEWTPDNGVLTAAMKLKRSVIAQKYKLNIQTMFSKA